MVSVENSTQYLIIDETVMAGLLWKHWDDQQVEWKLYQLKLKCINIKCQIY